MIKKSLLIFVSLSVIASGLNYLIYPIFSRVLVPNEYINITVALSLFTQVSTFLSSILAITIGLSKDTKTKDSQRVIELLQAFLFKLFLVLAVIFLILSPIIMKGLQTPVLFAIPITIMMLLSIPVLIISGYLNGKNQMIGLGVVTVISATSQFVIGLATSLLTHNGLLTMFSMVVAQFITIALVYSIFSKDKLPRIINSLKTPIRATHTKEMNSLIFYTAVTSLAIMAISLVQVVDLFVSQNLRQVDTKFYADIYVISRIVFFAGMIFVWPFLGEISTDHHHLNRKPFYKLMGYFTVITLVAGVGLYLFGDKLAHVLFGVDYSLISVQSVGLLSISYKFFLLIITATILYFVVLRSLKAIWLALGITLAIFLFTQLLDKDANISTALIGLNVIAGISAIIASSLLLTSRLANKS
ncbi:MAG: hypothetical protein JWN12_429 [Candidatus Saccharibacteria bacterium]|nr:hypothetical protein [Candidatus Saccharibacteria bacterium]